MKIILSKKGTEPPVQMDNLEDTFDDGTVQKLENYYNDDPQVLNQEALKGGKQPVNEGNLNDYLADENVDSDQVVEEEQEPEVPFDEVPEGGEVQPELKPEEPEEIPWGESTQTVLKWAIENRKVLKIYYKTQGRKKRRGIKLRREMGLAHGALIHRTIEPHYIFQAKTGNLIVVTWDKSVREIRAFIINNIINYEILDRKPFKIKNQVLPGYNIGEFSMANINNSLKEVHAQLTSKGLIKTASVVQGAIQSYQNFKTAQYVGVQGYWLRNRRCWDNCYRQKRTTTPQSPAQEVWGECWKEYLASINDDKSGWEKYASSSKEDPSLNISEKDIKEWNKLFAEKVENKVKLGFNRAEAIYTTIDDENERYFNKLTQGSSDLMEVASSLKESGEIEIAQNIANVVPEIMKEAGFWSAVGTGLKNIFIPMKKQIMKILDEIATEASGIANKLRGRAKYKIKGGRVEITRGKKVIVAQNFTNTSNEMIGKDPDARYRPGGNLPTTSPSNVTAKPGVAPKYDTNRAPAVNKNAPKGNQLAAAKEFIDEVRGLVTKIDKHLTWIYSNVPQNDPNTKGIFNAAFENLNVSKNNINKLLESQDIKMFSGVAVEMDKLANAARLAMQRISSPEMIAETMKDLQNDEAQPVEQTAVQPQPQVQPQVQPETPNVDDGIKFIAQTQNISGLLKSLSAGGADNLNYLISLFNKNNVPLTLDNLNSLKAAVRQSAPQAPVETPAAPVPFVPGKKKQKTV